MSPSDLSNIVAKMKTQASTTLGWDVVVNYGEIELNNLLAAAYEADSTGNKAITEFRCKVTSTDDETGDDHNIDYTFEFGPPSITFLETDKGAMCSLTIPVMGGKAIKDGNQDKAQDIGTNVYTITLNNLLLATAKGGVTDDEVSSENPTPYDKPFVFSTSSEESGIVFIDFEASDKDLAVDITFTGPDVCKLNDTDPNCKGRSPLVDSHKELISGGIKHELLTTYKHVIYELARTNNKKPSGGIKLVPKSFMFASFVPDDGETILSLFIQTRDTNNGIQSRLNSNWNVLWGTTLGCPPIPSGSTASGLYLSVDTKERLEEPEYTVWDDPLLITYHSAINVLLPKLQLTLEQDPTSKPGFCRGSWSYEYRFSWSAAVVGLGESRGSATVQNTLNDNFPIKISEDYKLTLNFKVLKDDWSVKVIPDSTDFWDQLGGGSDQTPTWILSMNIGIPDLEINMGSLDYFLTTNLLLPTRKVIDIDTELGLQIPGDFFIVGNVETSK
ncbi:hypothetical protein Clacol_003332 [Clathrus columnatus]|uniref:Uncharacterized protein n=1 Tax=Clathrus columnatus TaxID=1419009 RepID=A0AAV5A803_9AGAM|nr:hypothetical protein Clacol_003332 [Clathrus columnatus]